MINWKDFVVMEWKSIVRSPLAGQTISIKILWIVLIALLVAQVSFLGIYLPAILRKISPEINPIDIINRFLWGYFLGDLLVRVILINIPAAIIHQYLHCNIRRGSIAGYLMAKSLINFSNAIGIGLWLSFSISYFGISFEGLAWFSGIVVVLGINTLLILLAASFGKFLFSFLFGAAIICVVGVLEYLNIPLLRDSITLLFNNLGVGNYTAIIIPVITLLGLIKLVYQNIIFLMYVDRLTVSRKEISVDTSTISKISSWRFEWLLIFRNRRLRTMIITMYGMMSPLFLLQLANSNDDPNKPLATIIPVYVLSFYLLMGSSMWGQLSFISESTFFDVLAVLPQSWEKFLRRKYLISLCILTLVGIVATIIDYTFLDMKHLSQIIALYVFHCGTSIFLILYRSTLHRQRFEIESSAWFNYQGSSYALTDFLILLNALVGPIFFFVFNKCQLSSYFNLFFFFVGGVSLLFYKKWMDLIHKSFLKRRYAMMEGFRTKL